MFHLFVKLFQNHSFLKQIYHNEDHDYKLLEELTHKPKTLIDYVDDSTLHRS